MQGISSSEAAKIGAETAIAYLEKTKKETAKHKHDRRLRNTKLLLRNYNNFKEHCKNAIYTSDQINAVEILDEYDNIDDETLYINSIKKTQARTLIILKHIDRMLEFYEWSVNRNNDENAIRRFKAMKLFYMIDKKLTYDEIAENLHVSERTIFRDIKQAVEELSVLIFGVDGLKLETD